jgi:flavin-dependent dehydrogenase
VGDAAGLLLPITFEGLGSALKSGFVAAESIIQSMKTGKHAASFYLPGLESILETIRRLCDVQSELDAASDLGPRERAFSLLNAYRETLVLQGS